MSNEAALLDKAEMYHSQARNLLVDLGVLVLLFFFFPTFSENVFVARGLAMIIVAGITLGTLSNLSTLLFLKKQNQVEKKDFLLRACIIGFFFSFVLNMIVARIVSVPPHHGVTLFYAFVSSCTIATSLYMD